MKKTIRFLSLLLVTVLVIGLYVPVNAAGLLEKDTLESTIKGGGRYASNWKYWSQGASQYEKMRKWGCGLVALSKMMVESGIKSSGDFTPDDYYLWARENGHVASTYNLQNFDKVVSQYSGVKVTYKKETKKTSEQDLLNYLNEGKYIVLRVPGHYIYVLRNASINAGEIMISNSKSKIYDNAKGVGYKKGTDFEAQLHHLLSTRSDKGKIEYALVYTIGGAIPPSQTNNDKKGSVTFSNYQVRKLTETSAEPYATATAINGKVARVGMFIGESKNSMIELGTDNGTPKVKKNMWYNTTKYGYPLEPGTTYYYQPYAEVNGKRYDGDIKSFTTSGEKYVPEPEPVVTPTPTPDPTVTPKPEPTEPAPSQEPSGPTYTALVTCNADNLNVRKGPGTNYDKVGSLKRGSKCTVYPNKASGGWSWVEDSGISGYVSTDRLTKFTGNTRTGVVTCNADVLNVRKGPGTSYDKVGQIPNGASCTVYLDVKADWYFVTYGDIAGYASKNKITLK